MSRKPYYTFKRPDGNESIGVVVSIRSNGERIVHDLFDIPHMEIVKDVPMSDMTMVDWLDDDSLKWVYEQYQKLVQESKDNKETKLSS